VQPLSDPPAARELAQFLDPDGMAYSFHLERSGDETTAYPSGRFGPVAVWFMRIICALVVVGLAVAAAEWWGNAHPVMGVALFCATTVMALGSYWFFMLFLNWWDQMYLVHGPFARWNPAAGTIELPRLGITLHRDRVVGAVCLTGGECWGGRIRWGARCPIGDVRKGFVRHNDDWVQVSELSVITQAADGTLARYPLITVENPWRFREFAVSFASDFGLPLQVIPLNHSKQWELRREGWTHAGEFADADRPRKVAAGRVSMCNASFPGFGTVTLCRPRKTGAPNEVMDDSPRADSPVS
jgi:hypothetical protein